MTLPADDTFWFNIISATLSNSAHFHLNINPAVNVLWLTNRLQASNSNEQFHFKAEAFFIKKKDSGANNEMTLLVLATCNEHGNLRLSLYDMAQLFLSFSSNKFPNALCMSSSFAVLFFFALQESSFSCYFFILVKQQRNLHHLRWCCAVGDANKTKKNPQPERWILKNVSCFSLILFLIHSRRSLDANKKNFTSNYERKPYKHQILM